MDEDAARGWASMGLVLAVAAPVPSLAAWAWASGFSFAGNVGDVGLGAALALLGTGALGVTLLLALASLGCLALATRAGAWGARIPIARALDAVWIVGALVGALVLWGG